MAEHPVRLVAIRLMLTLDEKQPKIPQVDLNRDCQASRLRSLWDMLKLDVRNLWLLVSFLDSVREKDVENLRKLLPQLRDACRSLKLAVSVLHIDDMATLFPTSSGFTKALSDDEQYQSPTKHPDWLTRSDENAKPNYFLRLLMRLRSNYLRIPALSTKLAK